MSKKIVDGVWVIVCDWVSDSGVPCVEGVNGEPRMSVDPDGGKAPEAHYQCGAHHGILKQEDKPEFQLPEGHTLNEEVLRQGDEEISVEEIEDE